ncbi:MAG TPA: VOC family protein [Kofleriaceae bacterium]
MPVKDQGSVLRPYVLGHGTLEVRDLAKSRAFYEQFLGLECVQHAKIAIAVRLGMKFHIFAVEVGDEVKDAPLLHHWGLDVESKDAVDKAHALALEHKDKFGILAVHDVVDQHGVYSFYLQDLDMNWWEIQFYAGGFQHDDLFDFGDRF